MSISKIKDLIPAPKDATSYDLVLSTANIQADADGNILTGAIDVKVYKVSGSTRTEVTLNTGLEPIIVQYSVDGGSWQNCTTASGGRYVVPETDVKLVEDYLGFRLRGVQNHSYVTLWEWSPIGVVWDGARGERGKAGRYYYFAGAFVQGTEYTADDYTAPYVGFSWEEEQTVNGSTVTATVTRYYMLVATTNKRGNTYIAPRTGAASGVWSLMETNFKWLITEAFFTTFGKLAAAIFSGDWMFSQYGKLYVYVPQNGNVAAHIQEYIVDEVPNGTDASHWKFDVPYNGRTPYTYFDTAHPNGSTPTAQNPVYFAPAFALDLKTSFARLANGDLEISPIGNITMTGITKRKIRIINDDNYSLFFASYAAGVGALNFERLGCAVRFEKTNAGPITFVLPHFHSGNDSTVIYGDYDAIRGFVGTELTIYNYNQNSGDITLYCPIGNRWNGSEYVDLVRKYKDGETADNPTATIRHVGAIGIGQFATIRCISAVEPLDLYAASIDWRFRREVVVWELVASGYLADYTAN